MRILRSFDPENKGRVVHGTAPPTVPPNAKLGVALAKPRGKREGGPPTEPLTRPLLRGRARTRQSNFSVPSCVKALHPKGVTLSGLASASLAFDGQAYASTTARSCAPVGTPIATVVKSKRPCTAVDLSAIPRGHCGAMKDRTI